jgi:hypothetical protein
MTLPPMARCEGAVPPSSHALSFIWAPCQVLAPRVPDRARHARRVRARAGLRGRGAA